MQEYVTLIVANALICANNKAVVTEGAITRRATLAREYIARPRGLAIYVRFLAKWRQHEQTKENTVVQQVLQVG